MKEGKHTHALRRILLWMAAAVLLLAAGVAAMNLIVILSTRNAVLAPEEAADVKADCILILGCGLRADGYPSEMLCDRLDTGIDAYRAGASDRILMSGDHGQPDYDEVNAMKDYAIARGVPSEAIFMDHAGFSTYESMVRARKIFGCESALVITQRYHLYRALYDARAMGIEARGIAADRRHYVRQNWFSFREAGARCKDFVYCILKPAPTYLGDPISLRGSGDVTNDR